MPAKKEVLSEESAPVQVKVNPELVEMITSEEIRNSEVIKTYINAADDSLSALGYTEHSFAHVTYVAEKAGSILETLGYPERMMLRNKSAVNYNMIIKIG